MFFSIFAIQIMTNQEKKRIKTQNRDVRRTYARAYINYEKVNLRENIFEII